MATGRRGFLRAIAGALALLAGPGAVSRKPLALGETRIHRATRNTLFGAMGGRLRLPAPPKPFKRYRGTRRIDLPAVPLAGERALAEVVRRMAPAAGFGAGPIPLEDLARLLYFANGVTSRPPRSGGPGLRAAPSAGALYSGEVYVAARRVEGLPAGLYYYAVGGHRLVALPGAFDAALLESAFEELPARDAAACVLLTNVFGRYAWRYANRAYRYALIDSGHIGENLRIAAASAGVAERAPLRFHDDALNELLAIDGRREAVCAVHLLGAPGTPSGAASGDAPRFVERQHAGAAKLSGGSVPERFHEATKLVPGAGVALGPPPPAALELGPVTELPAPLASRISPEAAIRARRSAKRFHRQALTLEKLSAVLAVTRGAAQLERAPGIDLLLVVLRVKGIPRGLYRYRPDPHALVRVREEDLRRPFSAACLGQKMARTAAVGFLMVARRMPAVSPLGDRRYRDLLLEAGAVGQRVYLAAESIGVAARNLAAFRDDSLNTLVGLDARGDVALHLTMLGEGS